MPSQPVAVLISGGLDSTVALHWAAHNRDVVTAISFDYGSKHAEQELECARKQCELLNVKHRVIDISPIAQHLESSLLKGGSNIPDGSYATDNMKQTVVPFRNGIFLSIAAGIAESQGAKELVIAAHSGDHTVYPDCSPGFMEAMSEAIKRGTFADLSILSPFIHINKIDIVNIGHTLGVDFSLTYSCYKGQPLHCGTCATCRERKQAFIKAGVPDPTVYQK